MSSIKPKLIVIVGQTSTGKSDYAVKLALRLSSVQAHPPAGAEIVSADSRQVYKGLNIGSGKITQAEMQGIPHHMLDVADPKDAFSVSDFKKMSEEIIDDIIARGKTPILVGGTGFYIDAIVNGNILPEVEPDKILRKKLSSISVIANFEALKKIDLVRAKTIDKNNNVRIIRAIEIALALGKVPQIISEPKYDVEIIGLTMSDDKLKQRIHDRLISRIEDGMIEEVKNLHERGLSFKRLHELGLEYRYVSLFFQNKLNKEEMLTQLQSAIWHYAKRQKTWFKRDKRIKWIIV